MNLQMLKKAMLAYVSAVKFIWSGIAYPLSIVGKKLMNLRGYRIYGNSVQDGTPTPDNPVEIESVGDLTKNLLDIDTFNTTAAAQAINYNKTTGIITCNYGVYGNFTGFYSNIKTLKAGTYTMSCEVLYDPISSPYNSTMYMHVAGYDENGTKKYYKQVVSVSDATTWTKKTATLNVDTDIDMSDDNSTITGIAIQLAGNSKKYTGLNLQIRNVMIEEGTTATDYEPYHKYKIPVVARGKNLFDGILAQKMITTSTGIANNNTSYASSLNYQQVKSSTNYVVSTSNKAKRPQFIFYYDVNYNYLGYSAENPTKFTTPADCKYIKFRCISNDLDVGNIQIEEGTSATEYEPYIPPVTTNIFLDEPLRKVGNYADYVDFERQKVVRNVEVLDDTGTKTIDESLGVINPPTEETVTLPALPQFKGTTIYEVGTNIKPSGMEAKYC